MDGTLSWPHPVIMVDSENPPKLILKDWLQFELSPYQPDWFTTDALHQVIMLETEALGQETEEPGAALQVDQWLS